MTGLEILKVENKALRIALRANEERLGASQVKYIAIIADLEETIAELELELEDI